jgi:uncharacterized protein (DUF1330 family)
MSAYLVFTKVRTLDAAEMAVYTNEVAESFKGHPIKLLAAYGAQEVLEGDPVEGVVIVEFPSYQAAKQWYDSPAYREVREHRFKGAEYRCVLVQGV